MSCDAEKAACSSLVPNLEITSLVPLRDGGEAVRVTHQGDVKLSGKSHHRRKWNASLAVTFAICLLHSRKVLSKNPRPFFSKSHCISLQVFDKSDATTLGINEPLVSWFPARSLYTYNQPHSLPDPATESARTTEKPRAGGFSIWQAGKY
jgi:hypothetical protein